MKQRLISLALILAILATGVFAPAAPAWAETQETTAAAPAPEPHEAAPAEEAHGQGDDIGFPQLKPHSYPSQVFWLGVAFVLLYTLMSKIALPRVTEVLELRRQRKAGDLSQAAQLTEEAEKIRAVFEKSLAEAQKSAAEVMAVAEKAVSDKTSEAQSTFADNSRKRMVAAEQNISKAKVDALHSLADISAEIAADMVQKITDTQVNKADAKKAVLSVMQQKE